MVCPNGIKKSMLVSIPRSGHHLLVRGLNILLEGQLIYSNHYESKHNMSNCDYVNLQKSHDFDMTDEINPQLNYIILTRDNTQSTTSWFNMLREHEGYSKPFDEFLGEKLEYYSMFNFKYLEYDHIPNKMVITYSDLINNKIQTVQKVAEFMLHNQPLKPHHLEHLKRWEQGESNI